jgi:hypothetical protein
MTVIDKINIAPVNLEDQKITEFSEIFLEIRDNSLYYSCKFYADEPKDPEDKTLGWKNLYNRVQVVASKEHICGLEKSFIANTNHWGVYALVDGFAQEIRVFFKKENEATAVFDKLHKWLYE